MLIELFSLGVTAKVLRAKIDRKSTISLQRGQFDPKFQLKGVAPPQIIFAPIVRPMNALQLCCKAFPVAAAKVRNMLPPAITSLPSLQTFKRALKTELFRRSYDNAH